MTKFATVLLINISYCALLLLYPGSGLYHVWEKDVIEHYSETVSPDTRTYVNIGKDNLRTVCYPVFLNLIMRLNNWVIVLIAINCLLSAWMFYIVYDMIGRRAWLLVFLGAFTIYTPMILTDLLFATLFVTSIWMIKKRLWLHFVLLGIASLVRPSLAWFFLIEPIVLYGQGIRDKRLLIASLFIAFAVTSFNPIRNLINHGTWTHSTVLKYNLESFYTGPLYFIESFKSNCLDGHYSHLLSRYSTFLNGCIIALNGLIWLRFLHRWNWCNVILVAYFIGPSLFAAAGGRIRLPIEWILLL